MATGGLRIICVNPGPRETTRHLREFAKRPGWITSLDDGLLPTLKSLAPDEDDVQVCSFGDLARRVLLCLGIVPPPLLTHGSRAALLRAACEQLDEEHEFFGSRSLPGFHMALAESINELGHAGWSADTLMEAARSEGLARVRSIAEVWNELETYEERSGRRSASAHIQHVLRHDPGKAAPIRVLAVGGDDWPPDAIELLQWLGQGGHEVTVLLETGVEAFGSAVRLTQDRPQELQSSPESPNWAATIFSEKPRSEGLPDLEILHAPDLYAECEWALRRCVEARSQEVLDHRMAIVVPDLTMYVPLLQSVAGRFRISLSARLPVPVLTNGFARFTLSALKSLVRPDVQGLLGLSRSTYLCAGPGERELLQAAVKDAMKSPGSSWNRLLEWTLEFSDRCTAAASLVQWREAVRLAPKGIREWHRQLLEWSRSEPISARVTHARNVRYAHDLHAFTALMRPLQTLAGVEETLGAKELTLPEFVALVAEAWDRETMVIPKVSADPSAADWESAEPQGVRVVSRAAEIGDAEVVLALGMAEGTLPRRRSEDPILWDEHRHRLNACSNSPGPLSDSFEKAKRQRDEFVRLCASAGKKLIFSYPRTGAEDAENMLSAYVRRLRDAHQERILEVVPGVTEFAPSAESCRIPADLSLRAALEQPRPDARTVRLTDPEVRDRLRPDFEAGIEIRQVAEAAECPFRAFADRSMGIRPDRDRVSPRVISRVPNHARLGQARTPEQARESLRQSAKELLLDIGPELSEAEVLLLEAGIEKQIEPWIEREFVSRELFGIDVDDTRWGLNSEDETFFSEHHINGKKVKFAAKNLHLAKIGPSWVICRYGGSDTAFPNPNRHLSRYLELALELLLLCRTPNPGIMLDSSKEGERRLHLFDREALRQKSASKSKVFSSDIPSDDPRVFMKETSGLVKRLIEVLDTADMIARPGDYCEFCSFGELCRVSAAFGEDSAFGEPGGES